MQWTDEKKQLVLKMWAEGHSCSFIAARIGGVSCNAVIGVIHRAGQSRGIRRAPARVKRPVKTAPTRQPAPAAPKERRQFVREVFATTEKPSHVDMRDEPSPSNVRKTIETLGVDHCRWPIGDPGHPEFHFCGHQKTAGLPYCERHARKAFQAPAPRDRVKRPAVAQKSSVRVLEPAG